MNSAVE